MPSDYAQIRKNNIFEYGNATHHLELLSAHYTNRTHFVFELLQNAEDAKASRILFTLYDDRLEVTHDGRIFNEQDVKGICGVGEGTKVDDLTQIGKFGIGFKSVYVYTSAPEIFSGDEHFRIEHYVRPYEVEPKEIEEPWTTRFVLPFDREDFNSEIAFQEIGERLRNLNSIAILFLRNIKEIEFRLPNAYGAYRRHDINAVGHMRQVAIGTERENWLIFERPILVPDSNHQVRVEAAFKLEADLVGNIDRIRKILESPLFVYFPTERGTRLGFLVQGPYRTTLGRDNIPSDDTWNKELIVETATLVVESMHRLKELNLLTVSLLEALPIRAEDFAQGSLFRPIFDKVQEAFMHEELLPANDGSFVCAANAKLARGDAIRNLLDDEQLGDLFDLFDLGDENKWLFSEITLDRTPALWHYLRRELGIEEVDPEMFARRLSKQFLEQQTDRWFIDFYKFLIGQRSLWSSPSSTLRSKPILRLQDGAHVNPSYWEGSPPNAYLPIGTYTDTSFPIIKVDLTQDEEVRRFLSELGVPEWDIVEEVIQHVLPKYDYNLPMVTVEDHRNDFEKIERAFGIASGDKRYRLEKGLQDIAFVLAKNTPQETSMYRKPYELYFESDDLCLYFEGNDSRSFVDLDKYPPSASELFKELEVMDRLRVKKKKPDFDGHVIFAKYPPWHKRGLNGFDPTIHVDGLEHAMNNPEPEKSAFIWNTIASPHARCIKGDIEKATWKNYRNSGGPEPMTSEFGELLRNSAWLPDSMGQMRRPSELTLDDLPESFERNVDLAEQLGMKRDEVAEFAVRNGLRTEILNDLIQNPQECEEFYAAWRGERQAPPSSGENPEGESNPLGSVTSNGHGANRRRRRPTLPVRPVSNVDRWRRRFQEELRNIPTKIYEPRLRSVRVTAATGYTRVWLKSMYTNDAEELICQLCKETMPFKKRDGEYYFEAVEVFTNEHFRSEHEAQFLALCPLCAAKYKEFVKHNEDVMQKMINQLVAPYNPNNSIVSFQLGQLNTHLYFVERHWLAIKEILSSA